MSYEIPTAKFVYIAAVAAAAPVAAAAVSAEVHFDLSSIIVALITGAFGTIQIYMLSKLHTMVNSQQSKLNDLSQIAEREASYQKGLNMGTSAERGRQEATVAAAISDRKKE